MTFAVHIDRLYLIEKSVEGEREVGEDDQVVMTEGEDGSIVCRATVDGSLSAPSLTVLIDDQDHTNLFQVTYFRSP